MKGYIVNGVEPSVFGVNICCQIEAPGVRTNSSCCYLFFCADPTHLEHAWDFLHSCKMVFEQKEVPATK